MLLHTTARAPALQPWSARGCTTLNNVHAPKSLTNQSKLVSRCTSTNRTIQLARTAQTAPSAPSTSFNRLDVRYLRRLPPRPPRTRPRPCVVWPIDPFWLRGRGSGRRLWPRGRLAAPPLRLLALHLHTAGQAQVESARASWAVCNWAFCLLASLTKMPLVVTRRRISAPRTRSSCPRVAERSER